MDDPGHNDALSDSDGECECSDCAAPPYSPLSELSTLSEEALQSDDGSVSLNDTSELTSDNESSDSSSSHPFDSDGGNEDEDVIHVSQNSTVTDNPLSSTYTIVGDNIDKSIKPRYMRVDSGNRLLHYFHYFAVRDRIDAANLSVSQPPPPTLTPAKCAISLLPSPDDDKEIKRNITTHISRIIADHLETLGFDCSSLVEWHIPHKYQEQMSRKSEVVRFYFAIHTCCQCNNILLTGSIGNNFEK